MIFIISAPSGAGKTTICHELQKLGIWQECISHTTRPMRKGEVDGETYYFVSEYDFKKMLKNEEFAEFVSYDGNFYGISTKEISEKIDNNEHIFIIAEHDGYKQIKELYPHAIGIFISMTKEKCLSNMLNRGDNLEKANKRILTYDKEMATRADYDYVIKNKIGKLDEMVHLINSIIKMHTIPKFSMRDTRNVIFYDKTTGEELLGFTVKEDENVANVGNAQEEIKNFINIMQQKESR